MTANPRANAFPTQAGPGRRIFHTVLAVAGWCLFLFWWWLVLQRVSAAEVRFTIGFLAIAFVVVVLLTIVWVLHNLRIVRDRTARVHVRDSVPDVSHDTVGRELQMPALPAEYQIAARVRVSVAGDVKTYVVERPRQPAYGAKEGSPS